MTNSLHHQQIEQRFLETVRNAGLPAPDDVARLSRALVFLWYDTKAFVLIDLEELPQGEDPLDGLDLDWLRADLMAAPDGGFAETA